MRDEIVDVEYNGQIISFAAKGIPAKGYKVFALDEMTDAKSGVSATKDTIENELLKVQFDEKANIVSIYDKANGRETYKRRTQRQCIAGL